MTNSAVPTSKQIFVIKHSMEQLLTGYPGRGGVGVKPSTCLQWLHLFRVLDTLEKVVELGQHNLRRNAKK